MCASLCPATPSNRQLWTVIPECGCHSRLWPMSMWSSGLQVVGDPGAGEISTPQSLSEQLMQTTPPISHTPNGNCGEGISEHWGGGLESLPLLLPSPACLMYQHRLPPTVSPSRPGALSAQLNKASTTAGSDDSRGLGTDINHG